MARDEDEAWRAIVDNYGERPEIEPDVLDATSGVDDRRTDPDLARDADLDDTGDPGDPGDTADGAALGPTGWDDEYPDSDWESDRFVPPPPPPIPRTTPDRLAAWAGVFGSPAILLICLVLSISLPQLLAYLLVIGFVGGFIYLVIQMPREPRDPGDDGAVL